MSKSKSIVDYYRARAPEYEQIYYRDVPQRRKEIDDRCEYVSRIAQGRTVLDLACGTGYWTKVAAETAKEVVASDIAPEMIRQAKTKNYNCPVEFVVSDLYHLPFRPKSFDFIMLGFWFSHEPKQNYSVLFDSITVPLKVGGRIWMIDNNPPAEGTQVDSTEVDEHGNNLKVRRLENGNEYVILKNYFSKEELEKVLTERFRIIDFVYQKYYWSVLLETK